MITAWVFACHSYKHHWPISFFFSFSSIMTSSNTWPQLKNPLNIKDVELFLLRASNSIEEKRISKHRQPTRNDRKYKIKCVTCVSPFLCTCHRLRPVVGPASRAFFLVWLLVIVMPSPMQSQIQTGFHCFPANSQLFKIEKMYESVIPKSQGSTIALLENGYLFSSMRTWSYSSFVRLLWNRILLRWSKSELRRATLFPRWLAFYPSS